jgi:hypothetical protein
MEKTLSNVHEKEAFNNEDLKRTIRKQKRNGFFDTIPSSVLAVQLSKRQICFIIP